MVILHRALEASAEENAVCVKRKGNEVSGEMCSPADWIRQEGWPVGIRNVGNTCWFSAVIQVGCCLSCTFGLLHFVQCFFESVYPSKHYTARPIIKIL